MGQRTRPASADGQLPGSRRPSTTAAAVAARRREKEVVLAEVVKPHALMSAAELAQVTSSLEEQAAGEDQRLHEPRPINLRVGAALGARVAACGTDKLKFFGKLFLEWDPNRDGGRRAQLPFKFFTRALMCETPLIPSANVLLIR